MKSNNEERSPVAVLIRRSPSPSEAADLPGDAPPDSEETRREEEPLRREALRRIETAYPGVPVFCNEDIPGTEPLEAGEAGECLFQVLERTGRDDQDSVAIFHDFYPLFDLELEKEIRRSHFRYLAQYTCSENIPSGLIPDFASLEFARQTAVRQANDPREFALKNINDYDVELFYRLPDLRQFRLDFSCRDARSRRLAQETLALRPDARFLDLEELIRENPSLTRPFPSYFELEISADSPVRPVFPPERPADAPRRMAPEIWEKLLHEIEEYGLPGDATVSLAGLGDPMTHENLPEILSSFLDSPHVSRVYLETYGSLFTPEFTAALPAMRGVRKLHVIIRLSTLRPGRFRELCGADLLPVILENLEAQEKLSAKQRPYKIYVEMPRIKEVADEIDEFFQRFENSPIDPIVQKFNTYCGRVEEHRVSDLTPLKRDFCWHLARDFYLTAGGFVPVCRQDPFAEGKMIYDFRDLSIREIQDATLDWHRDSLQGKHDSLPMPCSRCDEWYTFNG